MNIKKNKVIFDVPFSIYLLSNHTSNGKQTSDTLQQFEEYLFDNFESHGPYIDKSYFEYIEPEEATDHLKKTIKATKKELDLFSSEIDDDILRALSDAKDQNYQDEWLLEYIKQLEEKMLKDLPENATLKTSLLESDGKINFDIFENEFFQVEVNKSQAIKDQKENSGLDYDDYTEEEILQEYEDDFLTVDMQELNTEFIDYYGTLGYCDNWLDYFKDNSESSELIEDYRKDQQEKQTNPERLKKDMQNLIAPAIQLLKDHKKNATLKNNLNRNLQSIKKIVEN